MPEFLNEDYVTIANELIFPSVQTCCALIATAAGVNNIAGYHLTLGTGKREFDRAVLYIRTEIGGAIEAVYLVGNVLGRPGHSSPELDSLADFRSAILTGLGYSFDVKYQDIGLNNPGVAVHASRNAMTNQLRVAMSSHGNWAFAANVIPAAGMLYIREMIAAAMDGNPGRKLRVTRPGAVRSCVINAEAEIVRFTMSSL